MDLMNNSKSHEQPIRRLKSRRSEKPVWRKSKAERQAWFANLSYEEREDYIKSCQIKKADERRDKEIVKMKQSGRKEDCSLCYHRITKSCNMYMPDGCLHFWTPEMAKGITPEQRTALLEARTNKPAVKWQKFHRKWGFA